MSTKSLKSAMIVVALIGAGGGALAWKKFIIGENGEESRPHNVIGMWAPESSIEIGCESVVFTKDDGQVIEGDCDNPGFKHHLEGEYTGPNNIVIKVTRVRLSDNCETSVKGSIHFINEDEMQYAQAGWNGCDARNLPAGGYVLRRQ